MAFRIVFHWGPKAILDKCTSQVYQTAFQLYPWYADKEQAKHRDFQGVAPTVAIWNGLSRDANSHRILGELCSVSRHRLVDPDYTSTMVYVPTTIRVLHVFTERGDRLPWAQLRPTMVWRLTPLNYLKGMPYDEVLHKSHSDEDPTPIEVLRRDWNKRKYERKLAMRHAPY